VWIGPYLIQWDLGRTSLTFLCVRIICWKNAGNTEHTFVTRTVARGVTWIENIDSTSKYKLTIYRSSSIVFFVSAKSSTRCATFSIGISVDTLTNCIDKLFEVEKGCRKFQRWGITSLRSYLTSKITRLWPIKSQGWK